MKSWTDKPSSLGECVAPPRLPAGGTGVRFRALAATLATCMVLFGFDALFPDVKRWDLPSWSRPEEVKEGKKPFEWAQVRFDIYVWENGMSSVRAIRAHGLHEEDCEDSRFLTSRRGIEQDFLSPLNVFSLCVRSLIGGRLAVLSFAPLNYSPPGSVQT
jgi:hypothetical protein